MSYERLSPATDVKEQTVEGEEKLTALQLEYTHLLSSQLESQREFFEAKITEARRDALREVSVIEGTFFFTLGLNSIVKVFLIL